MTRRRSAHRRRPARLLLVTSVALKLKAPGDDPMTPLTRITRSPDVMGGKPCIRGLRLTVGTIVGLIASGHTIPQVLAAYPYLEEPDIREALAYAAWRVEEQEAPITR